MKLLYIFGFCLGLVIVPVAAQDLERGIQSYKKNDFAEAAATLRKAVGQDADNAPANRYLGLALIEQGKASEAEPFILKANDLDPGGASNTALARLYVEKKDYDNAAATLKDADGEDVPYVRGLLSLNRKQYPDAARDLESYSQSHPEFAYAHYYLGLAYNGMKKPDKMLTHFEMFVNAKPDAPEARKVRSVLRTGK